MASVVGLITKRNDSPRIDGACAVFLNPTQIFILKIKIYSTCPPSYLVLRLHVVFPLAYYQMSDSDSETDTEEYEPPQPTWRWLEADEFMETEYMQDEFLQDEADEFANATWKPYPTVADGR